MYFHINSRDLLNGFGNGLLAELGRKPKFSFFIKSFYFKLVNV